MIDFKNCHDKRGYIINQDLLDFYRENKDVKITVVVGNWSDDGTWSLNSDDFLINEETLVGFFKDIYEGVYYDDNDDMCNLRIKHKNLGYFGGPFLISVFLDIDEETSVYLKLKGL